MKQMLSIAAFLAALALATTGASAAAVGVTSGSVNLRSGPGAQYAVVAVVPPSQTVTVIGCVAGSSWCDVTWASYRGWMSANYIYAQVGGQTVVVTSVYRQMPVVSPWVDARRDARVQYRVNRRWDRWLGE